MFKKKVETKVIGTAFDRLLHYNVTADYDCDDQMIELANSILANCPVLIDFSKLSDTSLCERILSFLSGVIYAAGGESHQIGSESFLFANDEALKDGSIKKWIKEFGQNN